MIEQFQTPKEEISKEQLKNILETVNADTEGSVEELVQLLLAEKTTENLSDEETIRRAMLLSKKMILVQIKEALGANQYEA